VVNPLKCKGSATSNNTKVVHWPLMGGLLHLVQQGETERGRSPPRPLLSVPNITAHPSTASVLYYVRLLCGFKVPTKDLYCYSIIYRLIIQYNGKDKWICKRSFCSISHSKRSGIDHTVLPTNYTICLYLVSVHQTALPLTCDGVHLIAADGLPT